MYVVVVVVSVSVSVYNESNWKDCVKIILELLNSAVDGGGAGGARVPPEFGGSEKGRSMISAYRSLAITTNTPGFNKLSTALIGSKSMHVKTEIGIF